MSEDADEQPVSFKERMRGFRGSSPENDDGKVISFKEKMRRAGLIQDDQMRNRCKPLVAADFVADDRYGRAAFDDELAILAATTEGARNDQLNTSAFSLGQLVGAGRLDEQEVIDALAVTARAIGLDESEIMPTIRSGMQKGMADPRQVPEREEIPAAFTIEPPAGSDSDPLAARYAREVGWELHKLRVRAEARQRFDDESRPPFTPPPVTSLDELLAQPDTPTSYRIDQVLPDGGRAVLSAQFKSGKTTLVNNLVRSLADGEPFLGAFDVRLPARKLALIDDELNPDMVRRWLRTQGIRNTAAIVDVVTLRGNLASFDIIDDRVRERWARRWRDIGADYLILDCLRPAMDALGLDENHDAGRFLVAFDALLAEAGIGDAMVVHHMGHSGERARGDSRILDWPDVSWRLVRQSEEPDSTRYFSAFGRDVNVPEGRLAFDAATRRLTYVPGSRSDAKVDGATQAVIELLAQSAAPLTVRDIEAGLSGEYPRQALRDGLARALKGQLVTYDDGPRGAKLHRITHPCQGCAMPVASGGTRHQSCPDASQSERL
ncbi:AAA family ATPase [Mycobacteroides abscessus]|uniref:AAA family ATPase n=1 Tax=Mycobacteroides abscessus TaxID=36809 RepID=UPI002105A05F|nr:AAA family ATPase [Mycobacteroides abscessus]